MSRFSLSWISSPEGKGQHVSITPCIHSIANRRRRDEPIRQSQRKHLPRSCPFQLSVINDELTPDFGRACEIATKDFGLHWIELRSMWNKNVTDLDAKEIAESQRILEKYQLRVTDIASPLFKVDWPGAPLSKESPQARPVPRRLRLQATGSVAGTLHRAVKAIQNRSHPLLRLLAAGESGALSRRDQRQAARRR